MGYKASCLFVSQTPGYFASRPANDEEKCDALRMRLGFRQYRRTGTADLESGLSPQDRGLLPTMLCIGAYPEGCYLAHNSLFHRGDPKDPMQEPTLRKLQEIYPESQILGIVLNSVVDLWGIALVEAGSVKRSYFGSGDSGIFANEGEALGEEKDGSEGEDLALRVVARMTGLPLDHLGPHWDLQMTVFEKPTVAQRLRGYFGW